MRATNRKNVRTNECSRRTTKSIAGIRRVWNTPRATVLPASFLGLAMLFCSFGCAPSSPGEGRQNPPASSAPNDIPEITVEKIREEINDAYVREVPEETGASAPISWRFDEEEPKEFSVVEKKIEGDRATITLDIKTASAPGARTPRQLAGQIRTEWALETGWALRRWEIVESENISLKYKNLPKPPAPNSDR